MFQMLFLVFIVGISLAGVRSQDCSWINSLDCNSYSYKPLCGSDYVTYDSRCTFAKVHCKTPTINILAESTCGAAGFSTRATTMRATTMRATAATTQQPATNAVTMTTRTMATAGTTTVGSTHKPVFSGHDLVFDFFCLELSHEQCPDDTEAVCGSDGKLYPNFCEFEKHRCSHRDLTATHFTAC